MLFNSLQFLVFFPVVTALYFLLPRDGRWAMLLVASCYFYMAFIPQYILILVVLILVDYAAGLGIEQAQGRRRTAWLVASVCANVGMLGFFKYFNFVATNVAAALGLLHADVTIPHLNIILPIGLSFHTFQSMSYTIEVYRGHQRAERNLPLFALYVLFWPQLVAGPIERPQNLLHQLREEHRFDLARVADGLHLMLWGMFKKVAVADRLALMVNDVYHDPRAFTGWPLLIATYAFAWQIYCDFSGYSDIARGAARVMGIDLMRNFDRPYRSTSIAEFWRRWHISLSTWFRDYVYIPLGGNRVAAGRRYANLLFVFLLSGLWHGANWTFVVWGALHGGYLVLGMATRTMRDRAWSAMPAMLARWRHLVAVVITFHLALIAWVFFRAANVGDAMYVLGHAWRGLGTMPHAVSQHLTIYGVGVGVLMVAVLELLQWRAGDAEVPPAWQSPRTAVRWAWCYVLVLLLLNFGVFHNPAQFIYFQF